MISPVGLRLRHRRAPFMGIVIICICIVAFLAVVAINRPPESWGGLIGSVLLLAAFNATIIYFNLAYRIAWVNGIITMRAHGISPVSVKVADISKVVQESSRGGEWLQMNRPTARLTIYGPDKTYIDVSMKHFVSADIVDLLDRIHECRPDLQMPAYYKRMKSSR